MLSGWCFDSDCESAVFVDVSEGKGKVDRINPCIDRNDVSEMEEGAPIACGFHTYLPMSGKLNNGASVELEFSNGKDRTLKIEQEVTNIREYLNGLNSNLNLSEIKQSKLDNLLLNESERIHHVKGMKSSPIYLVIDPSGACNLECPICQANIMRKSGYSMKMMAGGTFEKIMDRFGDTMIMADLANWVEPFLNENTSDFIRTMKEKEIYVASSSNFNTQYTDENLEAIVLSGLDRITAVLDGATQETYVKHRQNGSLSLALENIQKLVAKRKECGRKTPRVRWRYRLFDWNKDEIESARKTADEIGCDEFEVTAGEPFKDYTPSFEDRNISAMDAMTPEINELMVKYYKEREEKNMYFGCDHLYHQIVINANGTIHPCRYVHEPRHLFGSILIKRTVFKTAHKHDPFNSAYHKNARGVFSRKPMSGFPGYDPCLNCWIVTDEDRKGYVPSALNFFSAFELLTGKELKT